MTSATQCSPPGSGADLGDAHRRDRRGGDDEAGGSDDREHPAAEAGVEAGAEQRTAEAQALLYGLEGAVRVRQQLGRDDLLDETVQRGRIAINDSPYRTATT